MPDGPPALIAINHDDYHAEYVGHTTDGRQFFLTTPFIPESSEFLALYIFDAAGKLVEARIDDLGPRSLLDHDLRVALRDAWLLELGEVKYGRIEISPFAVSRFGQIFGLVPTEVDDDEGVWAIELVPGNLMVFFAPWDSGEYDT
jgi:hypothetical protein